MNIQSIMKQAQKMQKDLELKQTELNAKIFPGKYSMVEIEMYGNKQIKSIKFSKENNLTAEDLELLEDSLLIAINNVMKEIDSELEKIYSSMPKIPGMF